MQDAPQCYKKVWLASQGLELERKKKSLLYFQKQIKKKLGGYLCLKAQKMELYYFFRENLR